MLFLLCRIGAVSAVSAAVFPALGADAKPPVRWAQVAILPPGTNDIRQTEVVGGPAETTPPVAAPATAPGPAPVPGTAVVPGVVIPAGGATASPAASPGGPAGSPVPSGPAPVLGGAGSSRTPAPAPASLPPGCSAVLETPTAAIGPEGGMVRFAARFTPPECAKEPVSSAGWIRRSGADSGGGIAYAVEPNPTRNDRTATLRVGDQVFTVRQAAGKFAIFAAAPARLDFTLGKKKSAKQSIVAWSDDPEVTYSTVVPGQPGWLKLAAEARKAGRQRFVVEVAAGDLKPGKQEAVVEIRSPGSIAPAVRIPVSVTVEERRK